MSYDDHLIIASGREIGHRLSVNMKAFIVRERKPTYLYWISKRTPVELHFIYIDIKLRQLLPDRKPETGAIEIVL